MGKDGEIQLPVLPDNPREKAAILLRVAAQIEHALMVQYLYAGYSFKPVPPPIPADHPPRMILNVAIEEMSHLMTVQNLLRLIGEPPHLNRQDFGPPTSEDLRLFPFILRLEPVSHLSLAKYVVAESPAAIPPDVDREVFEHIKKLATGSGHEPINRVGTLYALLAAVFGTQQLLADRAAQGDPWYITVNLLAAEAADFYCGRDKLHLPDSAFHPEFLPDQATDPEWDRSKTGDIDEFRVHPVADRIEALEALRDIGLQGEGPSVVPTETAHFRRFYNVFRRFFGDAGTGTNPPEGVLDVPKGARIVLDEGGSGEGVISHPTTILWARLADLRYSILLASLHLWLTMPRQERAFLRGWCFAEMHALRRLGEMLPGMPRNAHDASRVAAVPFNLPTWIGEGARWSDLVVAFKEGIGLAQQLRDGADESRMLLLDLMLASDDRKLDEAKARVEGTTQRTRTDAVRDVLDWAAGAGNPDHDGQGRFWNRQHHDFVRVEIFGENVTSPASDDAPLLARLKGGPMQMPKFRPKLDTAGEEYKLVESWVKESCPDGPA